MRLATALLLVAAPATAQDMSSTEVAIGLGNVLASEEPCGLSYDHEAIDSFVSENVDPSDMSFASTLGMMTKGAALEVGELTGSQLRAHCAAIRQTAKSYGFVE